MSRNKVMILIACIVLALIVFVLIWNPFHKESSDRIPQAKKDICATLDSLLNRSDSEELYISGMMYTEQTATVLSDNVLGKKISDCIEYEIRDVSLNSGEGTVKVEISAPDVYQIMADLVEQAENYSDTEEFLLAVEERISANPPMIKKTVSCDVIFQKEHWYLVPNEELFNLISGNLYSYYMDLAKDTVNDILGEE